MAASTTSEWKVLSVSRRELNLRVTLVCGQSFRWREIGPQTWAGVINNSIVTLKQDDSADHILYKFFTPSPETSSDSASSLKTTRKTKVAKKTTTETETTVTTTTTTTTTTTSPSVTTTNVMSEEEILKDYFQLSHSLATLYPVWGSTGHSINEEFKKSAAGLVGVRILRQPPLECLYSFICSSNNNIGRITKMVESLCVRYGTLLGEIEGHKFHSFPSLDQLQHVDEATLRDLGFGYRAKYIVHTTKQLRENEKEWLEGMRKISREDTQTRLVTLMGVGKKVADCVALFSLDKLDVVPVDTHILQVAQRHMPELKRKGKSLSLTPALYESIGSFFRERFGDLAGWAHTVLFAGDLAKFQADVANANNNNNNNNNNDLKKEIEEIVKEEIAKEEVIEETKENNKRKRKGAAKKTKKSKK